MPQMNSLALTSLPNGFDDSGLRLSVVLTPSISTDLDNSPVAIKGTPFDGWTSKVQQKPPSWSVTFTPVEGGAPIVTSSVSPAAPLDLWPDLWTAIFGGNRQATNRKGNAGLHDGWRLSHNISHLHHRHRRLRYAHAQRALNTNMAKTVADNSALQQLQDLHNSYNDDVTCLVPPVLYLFPTFNGNSHDASAQVDQRKAAVAARGQIDSTNSITSAQKLKIQSRIDHALDLLETQEGARLQAAALYCVYRHCVRSIMTPGATLDQAAASPNVNFPLYQLYKSFTDAARPQALAACSTSGDPVDAYEHYVQMLLFHRQKPAAQNCKIDTPDFHQLLGMVMHYPAIFRPLGLAFDLVFSMPAAVTDGVYLVRVNNPFTDEAVFANMTSATYQTQCHVQRAKKLFYADSRDSKVLDQGYFALDAQASDGSSAYTFSQEDADGSALKFTDQINNAARASEFTSSAPTSMTNPPAASRFRTAVHLIRPTPSFSANPTDDLPAARTVGLALFHQDRLATLESIIQKAPPTTTVTGTPATPNDPGPLRAEDLMLGIRVDVKHGRKAWRSLCGRQSTYTIHYIDSRDKTALVWKPRGAAELAADEGFVTFGATQSILDDNTTQTNLHQSLFTWTGWSLAVPRPDGFQSVNPPPKQANNCQNLGPLSIETQFEMLPGSLLPALRFNDLYQVRCRVVDLAGNSAPCTDAETPHTISLEPAFSRHEPIRAPQFLLTKPIDRDESPGENIDHLIARDGQPPASRMLVPPRESLRLAELHNLITKKNPLPDSAFTRQNLMPDGSFPSVLVAHKKGWIKGDIGTDKTHNQDGIFTDRTGDFAVKNPFYPDPLAHYIRVKPFLISDDSTLSRPLGEPFYVEIDPLDDWPNFLATKVDLNADPDDKTPSVDVDNDGRPPSISVNLPPGYSVVLEISSAGDDGKKKTRRTDNSKSVALHQLHTTWVELLKNSSGRERLVRDLIGADTAEVKARHGKLERLLLDSSSQKTAAQVLNEPSAYIDGDLPMVTPSRTMTFIHAVRKPIEKPDFAPLGSAGDLVVRRSPGQSSAAFGAGISAHWQSTGKVTCYASWEDNLDDLKADGPTRKKYTDVAFAITASQTVPPVVPDFDGATYARELKDGVVQVFPDTRAHTVTYTLSAATRFRGYYRLPAESKPSNPPTPPPDQSDYIRDGDTKRDLTILSSARPPAPSVAYIVPAFLWRDTYDRKTHTWYSGRNVLLRVDLERPFLISGDLESLGVVIANQSLALDDKTQPLISRWGSDPTRPITIPISSSALTDKNLCQPDEPAQTCMLAEGRVADIKPCAVHYAPDRKLWFADIPINTLGSFAPFVRLALVRWQPQALHADFASGGPLPVPIDPNIDCRISTVVLADFIQLAPGRWVSVQRKDNSTYVVTVSGVFLPPGPPLAGESPLPAFTLCLYNRWYAMGKDTGWRQVDCFSQFTYTPTPSNGAGPLDPDSCISTWSTTLNIHPSASKRKYRILLRENEWYTNSKTPRVTYSQFVDLP